MTVTHIIPSSLTSLWVLTVPYKYISRFRTTINVLGDAIGAGIVYHLSKAELAKMDQQDLDIQEENENGTSMVEINKNGLVNKGYEEKS